MPPLSVATHAAEDEQEDDEGPLYNHHCNIARSPRTIAPTFEVDAGISLAARGILAGLAVT